MIAHAAGRASRAQAASGTSFRRLATLLLGCACLGAAHPAAAEVGAAVSVFTDARFRGYSLSGREPVAVVDLSYDDASGLYAAASATGVAKSGGIRPLGLQVAGGYAAHIAAATTIDFGAVHSTYSRYSSRDAATSYTEVYAGLTHKFLSSRVAFSPHYFGHGAKALYGELDANFTPLRKLRLSAHAGLLVPINYRDEAGSSAAQYDWRIGVAREVGRASLHVIATGGGPGRDYYRGRPHRRTALVAGVSWAL